jgi:hypothetical protein
MYILASSSVREVYYGPYLPDVYIKIIPHPNSVNTDVTIIPLTSNDVSESGVPGKIFVPAPQNRPWAPFRTLADFEYTETAVKGLLSKDLVNRQLAGFNERWSMGGSCLTIRTYKDMHESLGKAREYGIQVSHVIDAYSRRNSRLGYHGL